MRIPRVSVRSYVLAWITPPLIALLVADTYFLYRSALHSVNIAYDRTLLATTHAVGDSIRFENGRYRVSLPLALFEGARATIQDVTSIASVNQMAISSQATTS